jgi:flagellar biosynthesis/type III secretory pathway M-ring protein FliF/YscJ
MAIFENQIETIRKQMGGMDTSQRIALGLCAVVVAGSVLWLTQWSMRRQMVSLYGEQLSDAQVTEITQELDRRGEDYEEQAGAIMVRPEDRRRLFMSLVEHNSGPQSFQFTFKELVGNENVFAPETSRRRQFLIALMSELSMMIRTMDKVKDARVLIADDESQLRLGYPKGRTKATVQLTMNGKERLSPGTVEAMVRLVSGAVPRLEPQDVAVVDAAGRSYKVANPDDAVTTDLYGLQRRKEKELLEKIEKLLSHIPNHMATVSLKLDAESSQTVGVTMGEPPVKREKREETSTSNRIRAMEPGVEPNVGAALEGLAGARGDSTEKTEVEYSESRDNTRTTTMKHPGAVLQAAAAILIPRSYFVAALKSMADDPERAPTRDEIEDLIDAEKPKIRDLVRPILVAASEPQIEVDVYYDEAKTYVPSAADPELAVSGGVMDYINTNGKQFGLVALALMAMGMMFQMVRRSAEAPVVPEDTSASLADLGGFSESGEPIGEAGAPDAILIAQETDEGSMRSRQMAQQVSEMINDDPEKAASLVRRWIEREE